MGVAPLSVALAALVVNGLGAAVFFPLAAAPLALAILAGLSQRTWRDFGMPVRPPAAEPPAAEPPAAEPARPAPGLASRTAPRDGRPATASAS
jgi:hypothetical protein